MLCLVHVNIDGHRASALADTGASLSWIKASKLPLGSITHPLKRPILASGFAKGRDHKALCSEFAVVQISFENSSLDSSASIILHILDDLVFDVILGLDWMTRHGAVLNLGDKSITFSTFGQVPIRNLPQSYSSLASQITYISEDRTPWSDEATAWGTSPDFEDLDVNQDATPEELAGIPEEFRRWARVFSKKRAQGLPPHREQVDLCIELEEGAVQKMPRPRNYQLGRKETIALREYLADMLERGYIEPSSSAIACPAFFVPKKEPGELRMVVDYKQLNALTIKDKYSLPLISEIMAALSKGKIFSKIDLRGAYNLLRVRKGDEWKTTFSTYQGNFQYLVMPFGLSNAPPAFQRWLNSIFQDLIYHKVMVYLDDIICFSEDRTSHTELIHEVLSRLDKNNLYASPKKCEFYQTEISYLGRIISAEGTSVDPAQIKTVRDWPIPNTIKAIQRFLGFANYSRSYVNRFSVLAAPLTRLMKNEVREKLGISGDTKPFKVPEDALKAFEAVKRALCRTPCLAHWDEELPALLETDASNFAIGAILSQKRVVQEKEVYRPVAYLSRSFSPAEYNYDVHDKELLSIVEAFRTWRHLLIDNPDLEVRTDHRNLEYFQTTKTLTPRQVRWSHFLSQFRFRLKYRPGQLNGRCDALSRREEHELETAEMASNTPQNIAESGGVRRKSKPTPHIVGRLIPTATVEEEGGQELDKDNPSSSALLPMGKYSRFTLEEDPLTKEIKEASRTLPSNEWQKLRDSPGFGVLPKDPKVLSFEGKLFVPLQGTLRTRALRVHHDDIHSGHWGIKRTKARIQRHYSWPGRSKDIDDYVKSCESCLRAKPSRQAGFPLRPLETPSAPWQSITMDRITQLPPSSGFTSILVIVDRFSKMSIFLAVKEDFSSQDLATEFVKEVVYRYGCPKEVISDRGSEFTSRLWQTVCEKLKLRSKLSTAFHPQTDGQTERVNQTLEIYLRHFVSYHQDDWSDLLAPAMFCFNTTPHTATQKAPYEVLYGYVPQLNNVNIPELEEPLSSATSVEMRQQVKKYLDDAADAARAWYDKGKRRLPQWEVGSEVWLSTKNLRTKRPARKLSEAFSGPHKILEKVSSHAYRLELPPSMKIHNVFHISLLRDAPPNRFEGREIPPPPPIEVDGEDEYIVEDIVDERTRDRQKEYFVKWRGYPSSMNTWQSYDSVKDAAALDRWETAQAIAEQRRQRQRGLQRQNTSSNVANPPSTRRRRR
jgi:transposase InsO family protein